MKKRRLTRSYWTAAEAGAVLERIERSGLSVKEFADKHGLGVERLYRWKRRLAHRSSGQGSRPSFTEVTIRPTAPAAAIEIELPGGIALRVGGDSRIEDAVAILSRLR